MCAEVDPKSLARAQSKGSSLTACKQSLHNKQLLSPGLACACCSNLVVMPGLCDAHVHCTACTADLPALLSLPESLVAARAAKVLEGMLLRGFTTVRDAGKKQGRVLG